MQVYTFPYGPLASNMYLFSIDSDFCLVDPSVSPEVFLAKSDFDESIFSKIKAIFLTHAHFDHVFYCEEWEKLTNAEFFIHESDLKSLSEPSLNCSADMYKPMKFRVKVNDIFKAESFVNGLKVIHTPGHSLGSVCLLFEKNKVMFTGDTLFCGSIGRTDLPGGSMSSMIDSMRLLKNLDDNLKFYPGHGPSGVLIEEKQYNSFFY